jgi:phenylacetate-CoA ligase
MNGNWNDMWNPDMESMTMHEAQELQLKALLDQLSYVGNNSRFYQEKWSDGTSWRDVNTLRDFQSLPFTEKDEMRVDQITNGGLGKYGAVDMLHVIRVHSSSGTTGRPSFIGITAKDHEQWTESLARVFWTLGVRPNDVFMHATGLSFFVGGLPVKDAIEKIGATFVPIGTGASDRLIQACDALKGTVLFCTPSYAEYLAEYLSGKLGRSPSSLGLKKILLGAEPGGGVAAIRERIEVTFEVEAREAYGNSDLLPSFAGTCSEQNGNHILTPDLLYLEVIDPDTGENLPWETGVQGELVGTNLGRQCCPLVRFRSRDHVVINADPCSCGRGGPRILCIGRTDDMLIVSGVNVWPSSISDVVGRFLPEVSGAIRILIDGNGPAVQPPLHVKVEAFTYQDNSDLQERIETAVRGNLQVKVRVELVAPNALPRFEMKASLIEKGGPL